ncbi:MAG: gfo/Idh/MocA family oxidoreductase [Armatimonadetes bacterium]|nr:MAG: gfo/Idh/MocA family oxidoreductase [Armatimonadota bacterium]
MHPDFLPTGKPVVGRRRGYGELPLDKRLGVGILGLHEGHTLLVALRASGLCRAVAGCDLAEEKRAAARLACPDLHVYERYEDMLADPEVRIVALYTPDPMHADHIAQAFRAGKHVICTKPLLTSLERAEELLALAQDSGVRLQVGQSTRFFEPFQRQRELFESGAMGEVEALDAHYVHRMDWWYEKSPWTQGSTHWAFLGLSHPIDLARWYLGEIDEVHALGSISRLARTYGMPSPDILCVNLRAADGRVARVFGHYGVSEHPQGRSLIECWLMGSEGSSVARYPDLRLTYALERDGIEHEENYERAMSGYYFRHELKGMHYGEFCNYADYFASKLLSGEPNSPDLAEGIGTVAVLVAVVRSLESGQPVRIG